MTMSIATAAELLSQDSTTSSSIRGLEVCSLLGPTRVPSTMII
jgi:hypothetical protein